MADQKTIELEPVSSTDLMERAAHKIFEAFCNDYQSTSWVKHIFCGTGNNGGDGLALARMLYHAGHQVKVYLMEGKLSPDNQINLQRLQTETDLEVILITRIAQLPEFKITDVIIDAIFGTGLNKKPEGFAAELIRQINHSPGIKIAIDVPSGLFAEQHSPEVVFEADRVYTFQCPKLAFLLPENEKYVKRFRILDIKLNPEFIQEAPYKFYFLEKKDIQSLYRPRSKFSHKGSYGHILLIAGSKGKVGAAVLSSKAALRAGAGLLTVLAPQCAYEILQTAVPEAMCMCDESTDAWSSVPPLEGYDAVGIGPGIGTGEVTKDALFKTLAAVQTPVVLDADALNCLASSPEHLKLIPRNSILTPHPGEFKRLVGSWANDFERLDKQIAFSQQHHVIVVLKGAHSSISLPDGSVFFNSTGNSGMATAGSGDVLTGILTGLLSQGYPPADAALLGVYLHGLAGNHCLDNESKESLIASDIIGQMGKAFKFIRS